MKFEKRYKLPEITRLRIDYWSVFSRLWVNVVGTKEIKDLRVQAVVWVIILDIECP